MKNLLSLILIGTFFYNVSIAQSSLYKGGYGHFMIGPGWLIHNEFSDYLQQPDVLGTSLRWRNTGVGAGGEGFAELRGFLLGGGAYGLLMPSMRADSGTAWIGLGGGYFKTGYVAMQNGRSFLAITAAFGAGGIAAQIKNNSKATPIYFDPDAPIPARREETYGLAFTMFDVGLSYKVISSGINAEERGRYSGFMFGIDAGASIGLRMDEWRNEDGTTGRINAPGDYVSPYIRLTIGGGGFRKEKVEPSY